MTDPASLAFGVVGVVGSVIQVYGTVTAAYDLYIQYTDFSSTYEKLRVGLFIERQRLENFKDMVTSITAEQIEHIQNSANERARWSLIQWIFQQILETFKQSNRKLESCGEQVGFPATVNSSGTRSCIYYLSSQAVNKHPDKRTQTRK